MTLRKEAVSPIRSPRRAGRRRGAGLHERTLTAELSAGPLTAIRTKEVLARVAVEVVIRAGWQCWWCWAWDWG